MLASSMWPITQATRTVNDMLSYHPTSSKPNHLVCLCFLPVLAHKTPHLHRPEIRIWEALLEFFWFTEVGVGKVEARWLIRVRMVRAMTTLAERALAGEEEDSGDAQPAVQGVEVGNLSMVVKRKDSNQPHNSEDEGHQVQRCMEEFPGQFGPHP